MSTDKPRCGHREQARSHRVHTSYNACPLVLQTKVHRPLSRGLPEPHLSGKSPKHSAASQ
ncbi:hypothetical protein CS078_01010 [Pseudomonas prosekii]|uniref:Uncharacterized protein n=1 Tax=Pseudomonas prosekii TaxID=1148509 RepID=A0A3L8CSB1_9PSED|nr:hypothetical protein CS076_11985 [Pseudomonas prosekii]RLU12312.1 hypothetical protein CS078_01010 [Pseudomonas prosekii]